MSNSNIGIVIPTYNRPEYLKECLDSLKMADIPACTKIVIVDDCSTDTKVHELIDNFNYPDCEKIFFQSSENKSLNNSLLVGFGYCFEAGLAAACHGVIVTGDPEFKQINNPAGFKWL